jgi:hypothetical protein
MTATSVDPGGASVLTVPDAPEAFHPLAKADRRGLQPRLGVLLLPVGS